jgi:hypothetical protein
MDQGGIRIISAQSSVVAITLPRTLGRSDR